MLHKGQWGTVCDDGWGEAADRVVCRQLGCGPPLSPPAKFRRRFGPGAGRIWLDDVACSGKERSLEECPHRFWGRHNCNHAEDVAVVCAGKSWGRVHRDVSPGAEFTGTSWGAGRDGGPRRGAHLLYAHFRGY